MVKMSDENLPAPADAEVKEDAGSSSSVPDMHDMTNPTDVASPCPMTSGEVVRGGSADSDSGGSLSSSASPAPPPSTVTHDDWNTNEPSDGADSGVGANGSTPVDGDSLSLTFDGPATTGSPAYMLSPPFSHYAPVPAAMHPSPVTAASVVNNVVTDSQPSVMHSPVVSHPPGCDSQHDGCNNTTTTGSGANVMSSGSAAAGAPAPGQQYVVNVHVNAGETFSVRVGDRVQLIRGPATVRMVSNSGPPVPMPMQVPPGHMVQQIVDENGILTHVILSPQPPGIPAPGMMQGGPPPMYPPYGPGTAAGPYVPYPQHFPGPPPHHLHHPGMGAGAGPHHIHHPMMSPHVHGSGAGPGVVPPPPGTAHHHQCNNHGHHVQPPPPGAAGDERTSQARSRLRRKLVKRKASDSSVGSSSTTQHTKPSTLHKSAANGDDGVEVTQSKSMTTTTVSASEDGQEPDDEQKIIHELLSRLESPVVSEVEARSALIQLTPPSVDAAELEVEVSEFLYELSLSDKPDGAYTIMYSGDATEIKLRDLKPAADYFVKICCVLDDVHGDATEVVKFTTLTSEPDQPMPPRLMAKTKTSLQLKWNAVCENGSKVTSYCLEYDQGSGDNSFVEAYSGSQKQYKITRLSPSTSYTFRLAAVNSIGQSQFSTSVVYCTSGTVPPQPDPPMLSECCVKALTISWVRRPCDDGFALHMEDETTGHGFLPVYNGNELSYKVSSQLRRNTEYKFRLQATNEEGSSKWSEIVSYRTLPDRPQHPARPQVKGRVTSNSFRITWDEPRDTGGSDIQDYLVQLDAGNGFQGGCRTTEREYIGEHLEPGHTYRLRVCCFSAGGQSDWSEVLSVVTLPVPPGPCKPPKLHGRPKATSLAIVWEDPEFDGGACITEYLVTMNSDSSGTRDVYRGHDTQCTVAGLLPGRPYAFQVKANNKAGWGMYSEALQTTTGAGVPEAPLAPDVHFKSPTTALVSWQEPVSNGAPVTEYQLDWTFRDDQDFVLVYNGYSLAHELAKLMPATMYGFRVRAVNSAGASPYSSVSWSQTPMSSPAAVSSLRATSTTPRSIHLVWKEPVSHGSRILSYNIDIGDQRPVLTVDADTLECDLMDLMPETAYKVRVQAVNAIGVGAFSTPIKVTTRALPPFPPVLELATVSSNSVKLKWGDGKNVDLLRYVLEMRRDDYGSFQPIYQGTGQTHKVSKLSESTEYHFRIYASNEAGDGPVSAVQSCRTSKAPPPAPKPPKISDLTVTSCVVDWTPLKPLGSDSLIYVLQLQRMSSRDPDYHEVYRGPDRTHRLTGLAAKSDYQVRVNAVRQTKDDSGSSITLTGPFSTGTPFSTQAVARSVNVNHSAVATSCSQSSVRGWMSEQTWMFILILVAFMFFAIVVAFVAKQIVD